MTSSPRPGSTSLPGRPEPPAPALAATAPPATSTTGAVTLWIDPGFGASGDMLLGALAGYLDATGRADHATAQLEQLSGLGSGTVGLDRNEFELRSSTVTRCGLAARRVEVVAAIGDHGRRWSEIDQMLADADLPGDISAGARATFRRLGEVEAAQHGVEIDAVHFHEVGAVDAIIDIVGCWLLLAAIDPVSVVVAPVGLGHGTVTAAHGQLPLPAPATTALLVGAPVRGLDIAAETCTPTGAALLTTMADRWGPLPSGTLAATARGAGGRDPATHPNVVTVIGVVEPPAGTEAVMGSGSGSGPRTEVAMIIECNVDDATPEMLAVAIQRLLDAGADDAWIVPTTMKKGRAASEVRVLTTPERHDALVTVLLTETGSLGCRTVTAGKHVLPRSFHHVDVRGHQITIKVGPHSAKPELEELVALSEATAIPVRQLDLEARLAWQKRVDETRMPR